ncbi:MAG: regulatory protein RecX [Chloroflexota bacterium]
MNVHLDGEFAFGLARIVAAWLQVGQEIDDEKIAQLKEEDAKESAFQQALTFLSYRPRSEAEIRQNLAQHKIGEPYASQVITRLKDNGMIDDTRFANAWVENRTELRPRSRRALAYELGQMGVDRQTIDEALGDLDDAEMAYQAAQKRAGKFENLEWNDFRLKMTRYLALRGFSYDACSQAVSRVWQEIQDRRDPSGEEGNL